MAIMRSINIVWRFWRVCARSWGFLIASLLDTKGPEIRTGKLKDGKKVTLKEGDLYTLTTEGDRG